MTVLRRLDAALEDSKQAVLHMKATVDTTGAGKRDFVPRPGHAGRETYRARCQPESGSGAERLDSNPTLYL